MYIYLLLPFFLYYLALSPSLSVLFSLSLIFSLSLLLYIFSLFLLLHNLFITLTIQLFSPLYSIPLLLIPTHISLLTLSIFSLSPSLPPISPIYWSVLFPMHPQLVFDIQGILSWNWFLIRLSLCCVNTTYEYIWLSHQSKRSHDQC